jgi:hypothetical protein
MVLRLFHFLFKLNYCIPSITAFEREKVLWPTILGLSKKCDFEPLAEVKHKALRQLNLLLPKYLYVRVYSQ